MRGLHGANVSDIDRRLEATPLAGAATLATLYANGYGVPRDYTLAIRFACEAAPVGGQNSEQRIGILEAPRDGKLPSGTIFDLCDEQMSGAMGSYCSELPESSSSCPSRSQCFLRCANARRNHSHRSRLGATLQPMAALRVGCLSCAFAGCGGYGVAAFASPPTQESELLIHPSFGLTGWALACS